MKLALQHHGHKLDLDSIDGNSLGGAKPPLPNEPCHDTGKVLVMHHLSANKKQLSIIEQFWLDVPQLRGYASFAHVCWIASESSTNRLSTPYYLSLHCETILASLAALYHT